ncbi:GNAT family N-acetyltransferase [Spirosoma foliorum]|uniref:GNAT family N-acetyltransferase n=1 Tax=Spirosoma foliorum TaxID=2710596 RepID=A0A7G5GR12_9BACT|nr:GNAT family protein [Spirosoma foliorum]QMW01304.1 GNAT family N-acetyltransferase [Spirosoma foliorum]
MLNTTTDYILENERVCLRPLRATDFTNLLPFSLNEPQIWTYSLISAASAEKLRFYIDLAIQQRTAQTQYPFIVFDKLANEYAGCTRFYDINNSAKTALLGYTWYGTAYQGTGLNQACKALLLEFGFEQCEFERIEFRADAQNERSVRALQKIGCQIEGTLRNHLPSPLGGRRDTIVLSILKHEWFNGIKQLNWPIK